MPTYTVTAAEKTKELPASGQYSPKAVYTLQLDSGQEVQIFQELTTEPPQPGSTIDGTIGEKKGDYPAILKKDRSGAPNYSPGRSSGSNWTPKKEKEVTQQAMLKVAVEFMKLRAMLKEDGNWTNEELFNHATLLREKVESIQ